MIIVRDIKLLRGNCTGNLPFKKKPDQNKTGPNSNIRDTKSKLRLIGVD